ncbi:MAG: glutamate--cysteine ligase [Gammaproteobacteria bacterium]
MEIEMSGLKHLSAAVSHKFAAVEEWLRAAFADAPPPFYASTDLRNNGNKIAPVDTNLFPGGFNNLPPSCYPLAAELLSQQMSGLCPGMKSVLLVPEKHTRNPAYSDNVAVLKHLLELAGIRTCLGADSPEAVVMTTSDGRNLELPPIQTDEDNRPHCGDFYPCAVLLNNDLSSGMPPVLANAPIPVMPPAAMGWQRRRKSGHFHHYRRAAEQLAGVLDIDPYLLSADFAVCADVDFHRREGMECLAASVDETLAQIKIKYREHGIMDSPFVVLKDNAGTYGMGVMTVSSAAEVFAANRKTRNKMSVGKGGAQIREILIQEGVATIDKIGGAAAEPVVYAIGGAAAGGFWRINKTRGASENLNSRGMHFTPFAGSFAPSKAQGDMKTQGSLHYLYGVIARLSNLAAARETAAAGN